MHTKSTTCPNCGHCPHCGRSNAPYIVQPVWIPPYQPYYPFSSTIIWATSSGTIGTYQSNTTLTAGN